MKKYVHLVVFKTEDGQEVILGAWHRKRRARDFSDAYGYQLKPEDGSLHRGVTCVHSVDYHDDEMVAGAGIDPT